MKNWQKLMARVGKLARAGRKTIYDRVQLLVQIATDPEFVADTEAAGEVPLKVCDAQVDDTCANFTELRRMLELFPEKQQWTDGSLDRMRMEALRPVPKQKPEAEAGDEETTEERRKKRDEVKSWKDDAMKLRAENDQLRAEVKFLRRELKEAKDIIKAFGRKVTK